MAFLLPARAGMIPGRDWMEIYDTTAPRTRGDDPYRTGGVIGKLACSPHTRG